MFKIPDTKPNFPKLEKDILSFWNKEKLFEKTLKARKKSSRFVFYEGPPTANGRPGAHHILARAFKDVICRFQTMQGKYVERKGGWDTHGLPVELEVEKELGISGKQEILKLKKSERDSIIHFNKLCKKSVFRYVDDWIKITQRMGFWIDMENPYRTLDNEYIESVWWALKQLWNHELIQKDYKVVPYCPRCGTPLSSHEVALGYEDNTIDPSIYIKFKLVDEPRTFVLAWTTTPWTLPGNIALALGKDIEYVKVKQKNGPNRNIEYLILAKNRLDVLNGEFEIVSNLSKKDLIGKKYEPLYRPKIIPGSVSSKRYQNEFKNKDSHFIVEGDFVSTEEGTGIVHTAVMYGEEDFELGKKLDLPFFHTVDNKGKFIPEIEAVIEGVRNKFVKDADQVIIDNLKKKGLLYKSETTKHTYPFCWRCETPLLYYALESWFIKTTAVKARLIKNNKKVNWIPKHVEKGRMGNWLKSLKDWNLSRTRFWGTPLPIWQCPNDHTRIIGSVEELGKDIHDPNLDLHRPFIDEITIECEDCGGKMTRIQDLIDVWFDSGAMPFAQWHYPFENREIFKNMYPADYICEAMDQTRGWFYTLLAEATLLEYAGLVKKGFSYRNVISLGLVLDEKGQKMSKSKGNIVNPEEIMEQKSADAMRWYFYSSTSIGNEYRFGVHLVEDVIRRFLLIIWNVYSFFIVYANLDGWSPGKNEAKLLKEKHILDRWILSRLNNTIKIASQNMDDYSVTEAARLIEDFVNELSRWYVRRSRDRVKPNLENKQEKKDVYQTLWVTLVQLSKIFAPFTPFIAEEIYKNLTKEESVHLTDWPRVDEGLINEKLEKEMDEARKIVELVHAERKLKKIKVRQPLALLTYNGPRLDGEIEKIIAGEVNVKEVKNKKDQKEKIKLDFIITEELRKEGEAREIVRQIQIERKDKNCRLDEKIKVTLPNWPIEFEEYIKRETLSKSIIKGQKFEIKN